MGVFFCVAIPLSFVLLVVLGYYFEGRDTDNYKRGNFGFSPLGAFIIAGRLKETGQWVELAVCDNPRTTTSKGRCRYHTHQFESEADWMKQAGELAQKHMNNEVLQDVRVAYHHCIYTEYEDLYSYSVVWLNGKWV